MTPSFGIRAAAGTFYFNCSVWGDMVPGLRWINRVTHLNHGLSWLPVSQEVSDAMLSSMDIDTDLYCALTEQGVDAVAALMASLQYE